MIKLEITAWEEGSMVAKTLNVCAYLWAQKSQYYT